MHICHYLSMHYAICNNFTFCARPDLGPSKSYALSWLCIMSICIIGMSTVLIWCDSMSPIGCLDHSFHSGRYVDGIKAMVKDNSAVSLAPSIWYLSFLAHNPLSPFLQVQRTSCHPPPCLLSHDLCYTHEDTIRTVSHAQHSRSRILDVAPN